MSGHTPGPWVVDGADIKGADGFYLAFMADDCGQSVATANARLIAAAPALLAACEAALENLTASFTPSQRSAVIDNLEAAIALARGKEGA